MKTDCIYNANQQLGEGPLYHDGLLYWVDIKGQQLHRQELETGKHEVRTFDDLVTSISLCTDGSFVVTTRHGFARLADWQASLETIAEVEADLPGNRFNDAKVDGYGNLWAGTMDNGEGSTSGALYRLSTDHSWQKFDSGYVITNGPAFSPDGRTLYHNDTVNKVIYQFDLDAGGITNKRVFITLGDDHGHPDGITVDAEGCVWVCEYLGWGISRFSADGELLSKLELPVSNVTSCTFGGADLDTLYITTAAQGLDAEALAAQPLAGSVFSAKVPCKGLRANRYGG